MRQLFVLAVAIISFSRMTAQQSQAVLPLAVQEGIALTVNHGSDNKELLDLMRFQGIQTVDLEFKGANLKGKNYRLLVKEFTNGYIAKVDTIIDTKAYAFLPKIKEDVFKFKFFVKTENDHTVKMTTLFNGMSSTRKYQVKSPEDNYVLHDLIKPDEPLSIEIGKPTYVMGYFLPYQIKGTERKSYCSVSGSEHAPEDWGKELGIPNYFLIEVLFE